MRKENTNAVSLLEKHQDDSNNKGILSTNWKRKDSEILSIKYKSVKRSTKQFSSRMYTYLKEFRAVRDNGNESKRQPTITNVKIQIGAILQKNSFSKKYYMRIHL